MKHTNLFSLSLIFCALVFSFSGRAQSIDSVKLDSLIFILTLDNDDEQTVDAYLILAEDYENVSEYSIALTYSNLGYEMAEKIQYEEAEFDASLRIAHLYLAYYLDFKNALRYYDIAHKLAEASGDKEHLLRVYRGYSSLYSSVGQYQESIHFYELAIDIAEEIGDNQLISDLHAYAGGIYEESGDTSKAMEMFKEVVRIEEEHNFMHSSNAAQITVAHYYHLNGDNDRSLNFYRAALKRFERSNDQRWVSYTHAEMARVYLDIKNYERAEKHGLAGYAVADSLELNKELGDNAKVLAEIYEAMGKNDKAIIYQEEYDQLMDRVIVELVPRTNGEQIENLSTESTSNNGWYKGFLNAIIISLLIGGLVFVSGLSFTKG